MIIDLGCGRWPRPDADLRVDFNDYPHVDIKHNLLETPYPIPRTEPIVKVYLWDVIEHIPVFEIDTVLKECYRILAIDGVLDITCPDIDWIAERLIKKDWLSTAKGDWLNKHQTPFHNAMSYLFGGFYDRTECKMPGMGHIAGYNEEHLRRTLEFSGEWCEIKRVPDPRHSCILRIQAVK